MAPRGGVPSPGSTSSIAGIRAVTGDACEGGQLEWHFCAVKPKGKQWVLSILWSQEGQIIPQPQPLAQALLSCLPVDLLMSHLNSFVP